MEILWEEEGFQFGFKRWQGWAVSKVLWEWIPDVGFKAREGAPLFIVMDLFGTHQWTCPVVYLDPPVNMPCCLFGPTSEHALLFIWTHQWTCPVVYLDPPVNMPCCLFGPTSEHALLFIWTHQWTCPVVYLDPPVNMPCCLFGPTSEHALLFIWTHQWTCPVVYLDPPVNMPCCLFGPTSLSLCCHTLACGSNRAIILQALEYNIICNILAGEAARVIVGLECLIICSSP